MTEHNPISIRIDGDSLYANSSLLGVVSINGGENITLDNSGSVINVVQDPSFTSLTVNGDASFAGDLDVYGDLSANTATFESDVTMNTDLDVIGDLSANTATFSGAVVHNGDVSFGTNDITSVGTITATGIQAKTATFNIHGQNKSGATDYAFQIDSVDNTRINTQTGKDILFRINDVAYGYINDTGSNPRLNFTGQHRCFIKNVEYTNTSKEGLIVCADQNNYIRMNGGINKGNESITINESLPIVSLSNKINDKSCFGVVSSAEDPDSREDTYGTYHAVFDKETGDTRFYINSVGEGAVWVSDTNGVFESGDYVTTSAIPGYGMKQDSEGLMNYTVAKITMGCDFAPALVNKQIIKKVDGENVLDANGEIQWEDAVDESGVPIMEYKYNIRYVNASGEVIDKATYDSAGGHICAFVGCTYHCG
jgi:hypothetical protein